MRRLSVVLALAVTSCTAIAPTPPASPTMVAATPAPSSTRDPATGPPLTRFDIVPTLHLNEDPVLVTDGYRANGDEVLSFRVDFYTDMEQATTVDLIRRRLRAATNFRWSFDRSVLFDVPPASSSVVIDPTGAPSLVGGGVVVPIAWHIDRPATIVDLYRPGDIASGADRPDRTWTFPFNAYGSAFGSAAMRIDRTGTIGLTWVGPPGFAVVVVDLATGARTALPSNLSTIARDGALMSWIPDGRLLTVGTSDTILAGPRGEQMRWYPPIPPGQNGSVSPTRAEVALWSYTAATAAILDLDSGELRPVGERFLRCSAYYGASLVWSPDGTILAIGACSKDMGGSAQTVFFDATTRQVVRSLDGWTIVAWLPDGRMLARSFSAGDGSYSRLPDPSMLVLDAAGRLVGRIETPATWAASVSPDGHWLLDLGIDPQHPASRIVDLRTGTAYAFAAGNGGTSWTPSGLLAVVRN